ncbi:tetratricopeptide repeat protein [Thalassotalea ponticola]|uniref:tetratricopeptide repeat protein n=1 Tax=Thalassotalea ponticola TaxID=1523392 RepID=UPI0025B4D447|nr:tetratricopeptide repeat protein [Thalassotalea ponticola]MDN3652679.1 tetratricopeptide repeat protein [Thalassotalea ponticola]
MHKTLIALSVSSVLLSGCMMFESEQAQTSDRTRSATLAELDLQPSPLVKVALPKLTLDELSLAYKKTLPYVVNDDIKSQIHQRVTVLEMMQAEQAQERGDDVPGGRYYQQAIESLREFIADNPELPGNQHLLYQLAKAHDLQGEQEQSLVALDRLITEYPDNEYLLEAQFRRAEIRFSQQDYLGALSDYDQVVNQNLVTIDNNPYYSISLYMMGWSYFKLEQNQQALTAFSQIIDDVMPYKVMSQVSSLDEFLELIDKRDRQLSEETFAVMTLIFSAQGPEGVASHYVRIGERPYHYLNYDLLAQHYVSKQRYSDAVGVYDFFIEREPYHHASVLYSINKMDIYRRGQFPAELTEEKQKFVDTYQFVGPYWDQVDGDAKAKTQAEVTPVLLDILQEFSQNAHANAQQQNRELASNNSEQQRRVVQQAYRETVTWYEAFLANFPDIEGGITVSFYLAESFYEMGDYQKAAELYRYVAYSPEAKAHTSAVAEYKRQQTAQQADSDRQERESQEGDSQDGVNQQSIEQRVQQALLGQDYANEAGYALILAYDQLIDQSASAQVKARLIEEQQDVKAQFIALYRDDPRAGDVQRDLFQQYFELGDTENAMMVAQQALEDNSDLPLEQRLSALLVIGHSQFAEQQYVDAEQTYSQLLDVMPASDNRRADMIDRLAASIYRQGEQVAQSDAQNRGQNRDLEQAIAHFKRVIERTPNSKVRINAQYDLATYLLELKRYNEAIDFMADFKERYPEHKLSDTLNVKLAYAYQETEQWADSAAYMKMGWAEKPTAQETRQMLWLAAENYMKAGDKYQAMRAYRTYAHTYSEPFSTYMEAMHIMSEFYRPGSEYQLNSEGDRLKRNFWLDKIINADKYAGDKRTARSRYLAASASLHFADVLMGKFRRSKLTLPLQQSLAKKRDLLDKTLAAYNNTASYQVAEFTTQANYRIGEIYSVLAQDLMDSERPANLDELALEQYDILLEEQAFPFEDKAIEIHETNAKRSVDGIYDDWVKKSFDDLAKLLPARYNKQEQLVEVINDLY